MKLIDHLDKDTKKRFRNMGTKKSNEKPFKETNKTNQEKLSPHDVDYLMGKYRSKYRRGRGGALRSD